MAEITGIRIKQKVHVTRLENQDDWYQASVQDITDDELLISIPTNKTNPLVLERYDHLTISFVTEDAKYEFNTRVIGRRYDNIPMYALTPPAEYKRVQLRQFVRISALLDILCAEMPVEGKDPVFTKCCGLDISAGGIQLLHKKNFAVNTKLILKIMVPFKKEKVCLELSGVVVRTWLEENRKMYKVAVQFTDISPRQQDLIVRYTIMRMSEQRRFY